MNEQGMLTHGSGLLEVRQLCPGCEARFVQGAPGEPGLCVDCKQRAMDYDSRWLAYTSSRDKAAAVATVRGLPLVVHTQPAPVATRGDRFLEFCCNACLAAAGVLVADWLWGVLAAVVHAGLGWMRGAL